MMRKNYYIQLILYSIFCILYTILNIGVGSDTDLGDVERAIRDLAIKGYGYSPELLDEQLKNVSLIRTQERYGSFTPTIKGVNFKEVQKVLVEKFSDIKKKAWDDYINHRLPWQNVNHENSSSSGGPLTPPSGPAPPPTPTTAPPSPTPTTAPPSPTDINQKEQDCIAEHNKYRKSIGLSELSADQKMILAARKHSQYMAKVNKLAHEGIGDGNPWQRCQSEGTVCMAENVAMGTSDPVQVVKMWLNSPRHKANIEGKTWTRIGCGFAPPYWWTCVFGQ